MKNKDSRGNGAPKHHLGVVRGLCILGGLAALASAPAQVGTGGLIIFGERVVKESMASSAPTVAISLGRYQVDALRADGTVVAWGQNLNNDEDIPVGLKNLVQVSAGYGHNVALKTDGTVTCWGYNNALQCNPPVGLTGVIQVAAGNQHSIALKSDGTVVCWGWNGSGQCTIPPGLSGVVQVTAAGDTSAALLSNGTVVCWGANGVGQRTPPAGLTGVTSIAGGEFHFVALKSDGTAVCWGWNPFGQCNVPAGLNNVVQVAAGREHTVALKSNGTLVCWGSNNSKNLDIPASATNIKFIAAAAFQTMAIRTDGKIVSWGDSYSGPGAAPDGFQGLKTIAAGNYHMLAIKHDGKIVATGNNFSGQCDIPDFSLMPTPISIAGGNLHSVALFAGGSLKAWGSNLGGQLNVPGGSYTQMATGFDTNFAVSSNGSVVSWGPNPYGQGTVPAFNSAVGVGAGYYHGMANLANGTVSAWGNNSNGQLNVPAGLSGVIALCGAENTCLALKFDGTVVAWGANGNTSIQPPAGLSGVIQISCGDTHQVALKSDGTIRLWGPSAGSQLLPPAGIGGIGRIAAGRRFTMLLPKMTMSLAGWHVLGGDKTVGTVYLTDPAPAGGTAVGLSTGDPNISTPPSVTVPQGQQTATFDVNVGNVPTEQVLVTATLNGFSQSSLLTVDPAPMSISVNKASLVGGSTTAVTGTIAIKDPAPAGGLLVNLSSTDPSVGVPATILVPAGKTKKTFAVTHSKVSSTKDLTIDASALGIVRKAAMEINPFLVTSITRSAPNIWGGTTVNVSVTLNAAPAADLALDFGSSPEATVPTPATITVLAGTLKTTLALQSNVVNVVTPVNFTAVLDGIGYSTVVTVRPRLVSVKFAPGSLYGYTDSTCTVTLTLPAPAGGEAVSLMTSGSSTVPAVVVVPAGQTTATFTLSTDDVAAAGSVTLTASDGGNVVQATKNLLVNGVASFTISPMTFTGGDGTPVNGTVTLLAPPRGDVDVTLTSSKPATVSCPATVTVLMGQTTGDFALSHSTTAVAKVVKITASRVGTAKGVNLTVNP